MATRFAFFVAIAATASLTSTAFSQATYRDALIKNVPHVKQRPDFCGEACVEMVLRKLGKKGDQNYVFNMSGLDPIYGRGCYSSDLNRALKRMGFKPGEVFFNIDVAHADGEIEAQWELLHADLVQGIPSIVCMHYDASPKTTEHMRLVVGYRATSDEVVFLDPADATAGYRRMKRSMFLSLWPLKYEQAKWLIVRFRMEAADIREPSTTTGFSNAEYAQHILSLKKTLPDGFSLFVERPFVVVGNGPSDSVKLLCQGTVKWAVDLLKRDYFEHDPDEIITIWLFQDNASYRKYAKSVFDDDPDTPYGYYSPVHRALIMNIATGGGTLVHEIVHPFVRANFPKCPAWFNEGLGSLYEQSGERDGHIIGRTNWRLPGLQRAIEAGTVPSFKELTSTTDSEFYGDDKGTNYAQARYLCYYLQEQGKLTKFYHQFIANQRDDPTGYETLVKALGENDMAVVQKKWEKFVLGLKFGNR
jgi:Peptidase_C39 like family